MQYIKMILLHCLFWQNNENSECLSWRMAKYTLIDSILVIEYDSFIKRISLPFNWNRFPQSTEREKQTMEKCV